MTDSHHQRAIEIAPSLAMDPVSVAIVLFVLTFGSAFVYLFKADLERREKASSSSSIGPGQKKLSKQHQQQSQASARPSNQRQSGQPEPKRPPAEAAGRQHKKVAQRKEEPPAAKDAARQEEDGRADELDKSILVSVFNPPNCKPAGNQQANKNSQPKVVVAYERKASFGHDRKARRHMVPTEMVEFSNDIRGLPAAYSSEQLFNLIAASTLSREEVELAIETLLNKLESGSNNQISSWKQPKSDPLNRLKNQLRDSEAALSTEIQNHEQTRARLQELKAQLQAERSGSSSIKEEIVKSHKELSVLNLALEQARGELSKQQLLNKQLNEESSKMIGKLEQDNGQLNTLLTSASIKETEFRQQLEEKLQQMRSLEMNNQAQVEKAAELEAKLRNVELQLEQMRSSKHQDDYEACAKISDLESDSMRMDKALKDQAARLKEVLEANQLLRKSVNELQLINGRQEEMLKRLRDERLVNEASMKRTLCEMEQELKELQGKLSQNSAGQDERLRKEMSQVERELSEADQREQKLVSEVRELREGLATLLPDLGKAANGHNGEQHQPQDWVHQYLGAIKQLAKTVDELREENNNLVVRSESPALKVPSTDKCSLPLLKNSVRPSSRVSSPTQVATNGRTSKTGSHQPDHSDSNKKLMETKLLELEGYASKLELDLERQREEEKERDEANKKLLKELRMEKIKHEAQIKFGLDALYREQERVKLLEGQLLNGSNPQTAGDEPGT